MREYTGVSKDDFKALLESYDKDIYIDKKKNKVKTPANTRVISDESKIHPKNTKNKFGILGRVFMLMDILKTTNKLVLSYMDDHFKPFINVWFSNTKVIEKTPSNWDGVTFHDIDMYKEQKVKENKKTKTRKPPFVQEENGFV